jgi:hypothetical protein
MKKKLSHTKTLRLNRETLRALAETRQVVGGFITVGGGSCTYNTCNQNTCFTCNTCLTCDTKCGQWSCNCI